MAKNTIGKAIIEYIVWLDIGMVVVWVGASLPSESLSFQLCGVIGSLSWFIIGPLSAYKGMLTRIFSKITERLMNKSPEMFLLLVSLCGVIIMCSGFFYDIELFILLSPLLLIMLIASLYIYLIYLSATGQIRKPHIANGVKKIGEAVEHIKKTYRKKKEDILVGTARAMGLNPQKMDTPIKCPFCGYEFKPCDARIVGESTLATVAKGTIFLPWGIASALKGKGIECPNCHMVLRIVGR